MKTLKILKLTGIILLGLGFTAQVEANDSSAPKSAKNVITLTVDQPIIEYMAKAVADQVDANDVMRMKNMAMQIDHLTISFRDETAADYVLKFKPIDEQGLETWMFNAGYLNSSVSTESAPLKDISAKIQYANQWNLKPAKKGINLTIDKPIIDYLTRLYDDQIDAGQILRLQKMCDQIDHITVSFTDKKAYDYVLKFKELDNQQLKEWMFNEGIIATAETEIPAGEAPVDSMLLKLLTR